MVPCTTDRTTIVIITHNYARFVRQAAISALSQTRQPRVLIVDDASTDGTPDVVFDLFAVGSPSLAYYRGRTNQGLARMRNAAARMVSSEWIVYLDADDWLAVDFIERGEQWLDVRPWVDALTTDMVIVRDRRRPFSTTARVPGSWMELARKNTVIQTSFLRRDRILKLGGYDPALDYEDWDFWIRLLKAGYSIDRLPGEHVFRREHGLNKSKTCDERAGERQIRQKHPCPGLFS